MPFWLCVQTSFDLTEASPNNGFPFPIEANIAPNYLRVLGPFANMDEYHAANIMPFNTLVPPYGPNVTKGWYAVCPYNTKGPAPSFNPPGAALLLDFPPNRLQYSQAYGPYDTQAAADIRAAVMSCKKSWTPAYDICDPTPKSIEGVGLECSLVCTALKWPQMSGTIQVSMYERDCTTQAPLLSSCFPALLQIPLGCPPSLEPVFSNCWNGSTDAFDVKLFPPPNHPEWGDRGYTLRMWGTMCPSMTDPNFVSVSLNLGTLVHQFDINPINPPAFPIWGSCGTMGGLIPIVTPQPDKRKNRIYSSGLIPFVPSCNGLQAFDCINYVQITVFLLPMKFGCEGTAAGGPKTVEGCGLFTNEKAYSCASVLVEPLVTNPVPSFRSQYGQIGFNATTATEEHGCFYCTRPNGNGYLCDPIPKFMTAESIIAAGCPGDDVQDATQQIQYGQIAGFPVFLKRVSKGGLCVGMHGPNGWVTKSGVQIVNKQTSIPYISVVEFPELNAKLTFYIMEFPNLDIIGCPIDGDTHPVPSLGMMPEIFEAAPARTHHLQMIERLRHPCTHSGEALESVASCGCSGQPMRKCDIYGRCRVAGADWDTRPNTESRNKIQLCITCDNYEKAVG